MKKLMFLGLLTLVLAGSFPGRLSAQTNNDFDMQSDFTYVNGSLSGGNGMIGDNVSGSLTFTSSSYSFSSGQQVFLAEIINYNNVPSGTRTFYSGNWLVRVTPTAECRLYITWMGSGPAPSGNITINIAYQI